MQAQGFGQSAWFNATLDGKLMVQGSKWLTPMNLQQWPKSLPTKGSLELHVLQLPLSKLPWIARDGSIAICSTVTAPAAATAAAATAAAATAAAATKVSGAQAASSLRQEVAEANVDAGKPAEVLKESSVEQSDREEADLQADPKEHGDESVDESESRSDIVNGAASLALQSEVLPA